MNPSLAFLSPSQQCQGTEGCLFALEQYMLLTNLGLCCNTLLNSVFIAAADWHEAMSQKRRKRLRKDT